MSTLFFFLEKNTFVPKLFSGHMECGVDNSFKNTSPRNRQFLAHCPKVKKFWFVPGLGLGLGLGFWTLYVQNQYLRAGDYGAKTNTGPLVLVLAPTKPIPTPPQNQHRVRSKQPEMVEKCGKVGRAQFFERKPLNISPFASNGNKRCQNQHRAPKTRVRRVIGLETCGKRLNS